MSPPGRGAGRRRRRSHRGAKVHTQQHPHAAPFHGNHRRPRRQGRPQPQQPELPLVCPTWIFDPTGGIHVARDRSWFSDDYVPFRTQICNGNGLEFEAIGIGTAIITVDQEDGKRGEFKLKNVLHFPDALCNIVGKPAIEEFGVGYIAGATSRLLVMVSKRAPVVAYFKRENSRPFRTLMISGPPSGARLGPCALDEESSSMLEMRWPESERERFQVSQEEEEISDPLTDLERAWLKRYWRSEFKFLTAHALNIDHEGDRSVGRELLRQFMANDMKLEEFNKNDMSEDESDYHDEPEQDGHREQFWTRPDPDAHFADHYFSDDELAWIKECHGDSRTFLASNMLRFYNDDDCKEGKKLAQQLTRRHAKTTEAYGNLLRRNMWGRTLRDSC